MNIGRLRNRRILFPMTSRARGGRFPHLRGELIDGVSKKRAADPLEGARLLEGAGKLTSRGEENLGGPSSITRIGS